MARDSKTLAPNSTTSGKGGFGPLIELLAVVAAVLVLTALYRAWAVLVVVLALVVMVMVHELGHFATAKWSGMKVTQYFLGFGPRLWSVRRGETEYGVKAILAGGYVRIVGMTMLEEIDPQDEARSYRQASFPKRVLVAVAGSGMHVIMAFLLLVGLYAISGAPQDSSPTITSLARFSKGLSPAQRAGLKAGDVVVSVDGHKYSGLDGFAKLLSDHAGDRLHFIVERSGRDLSIWVIPTDGRHVVEEIDGEWVHATSSSAKRAGIIGVELSGTRDVRVGPVVAVGRAGKEFVSILGETFTGLGEVFSLHGLSSFAHDVATARSSNSSSSPSSSNQGTLLSIVGAVQVGAQAARQDVPLLLYLLAAINLFVGVVNLFPMLPLDGGHVAIAVYERIRSRKGHPYHADVAKMMPVAYLFLAFVLVVGIAALYMNIVHPAQLP